MKEMRVVLVKNEGGLLPIDYRRPRFLGITGPYSDCLWGPEKQVPFRKALKRYLRDSFIQLEYHPADEEALEPLSHCDVVIVVLGPAFPGASREEQLQMLKLMKGTGRPIIAMLTGTGWEPEDALADSQVLLRWENPGTAGAEELAKALFVLPE